MDFIDLKTEEMNITNSLNSLEGELRESSIDANSTGVDIKNLNERLKKIERGNNIPETYLEDNISEKQPTSIIYSFTNDGSKIDTDKKYDLQKTDVFVSSIIGGFGIILDFLVVKIPKATKIKKDGKWIAKEGSPLTGFFRSLGADKNGKTWGWITFLEEKCKVPFDKSVDSLIKNLCPKTHRTMSLAHDPSLLGFIFGIKDIINGTFSYIDGNGVLKVEVIAGKNSFVGALTAPIVWIGHLLSDIFTKAGLPIPGWCYLNLLQFGSIGDKQRTIAEVARYLYIKGYDLRHLVTMSVEPAAIHLLLHIYHFLVYEGPEKKKNYQLISDKEYGEIKNRIKYRNMSLIAISVASVGNIAKVATYNNLLAFNYPLWLEMVKESIEKTKIEFRNTKTYEKVIEGRHVIDENFDYLISLINENDNVEIS